VEQKTDHYLLICAKCQGTETAGALRRALSDGLPKRFAIRAVDCMAGCDRPTTIGFQAKGKAQYLFGDIGGASDIEALIAFAQQYENSRDGWTNATERPPALIDKTLSRMPRMNDEVPA